ncbi:MAG: PIN domain-containing protein [Trueperaceae bacterium]|nr:PIN domain-containing protein [Trueperaceae bacterium]
MIVADTSGLVALFNRSEPSHAAVVEAVRATRAPLVVSPFVVAEVDRLVATRVGARAAVAVLRELAGGAYVLPALDEDDLRVAADVMERYVDQAIGVADASLVVIADRYATRRLLTLDRRRFEVVHTAGGTPFELLP